MPRPRLFVLSCMGWARALALGLFGLTFLSARGAASPHSPICEAPEAFVLPNGVEVRLREDHSLPAVAVVSSVHAGARHDPEGHEGLAHYVEHLTFRSSARFTSVDQVDGMAGAFDRNARTDLDTTDFYSVVPPEQLELALWIEARRLAIGLDAVEERQALDDRKVVLREFVLRHDKSPELTRRAALGQAVFAAGHPYRRPLMSIESQERLSLGAARWFFARHYRPERVRLVILGDFQSDQAKALLTRLFGSLRARTNTSAASGDRGDAGPDEECRLAAQPTVVAPRRIIVTTPAHREGLVFAWPVPFGENPATSLGPASVILSDVALVMKQSGLADRVTFDLDPSELGQVWALKIELIPGQPFDKAATLVRSELARLARDVPPADDLVAHRQAAELSEARNGRTFLDRALTLVRRECRPSACVSCASAFARDQYARANRFDPRKAIVIEGRYGQFARPEGAVEFVPLEAAP